MRDRVIYKKEQKQQRNNERKQKMAEQAKFEQMTTEQRDLIESSKNQDNLEEIDMAKLKEAEALAAQIEAESYSKCDVEFENSRQRNFRGGRDEEALTDEQLVDLFAEMKKESHAKKMAEMQKFKIEKQESGGGDELLDAFNDELDAMRGEDSPEEDGLLQDVSNQYRFGPGRTDAALEALEEDEEPEEEEVKYYTEEFRAEIEAYRAKVATENKHKKTVKTNLDNLFQNFQVVTQQRHKISLEQINEFDSEMAPKQQEEGVTAQNNLAAAIFSEINPFAQFVIQDIL